MAQVSWLRIDARLQDGHRQFCGDVLIDAKEQELRFLIQASARVITDENQGQIADGGDQPRPSL